ncbi:GNAT family N-acetyltransferase [Thalassotalea litorea]|uniref:GNAT family N-acetyltransferase n=1 Tax=Thalassotalea litorea TaxID=2020715 RepID=A0A5R9IG60_9GAMM|nr:GNAT family N-acetyltransferase [Thalassotalea litorea]TLU61620.1 GNAT family N-acetyltransferase [Thalassotalea litorea]
MLTAKFFSSFIDIPREHWQSLFKDLSLFCQYDYLLCLERSLCVGAESGWIPNHLVLYQQDTPVAAMPLYLKMHSYGEYMFDWNWAAAYQQQQVRYYPKLLSAIPFTPVTGQRLAVLDSANLAAADIVSALKSALTLQLKKFDASNFQCLFNEKQQSDDFAKQGLAQRQDIQFHWFNHEYLSFADFVAKLTARKRKSIHKERRALQAYGLEFRWLDGEQINNSDWQLFYRCYRQTYRKRSGHDGYLNLDFFLSLSKFLAENCRLLVVYDGERAIASALFFVHQNTLYGRYWGALEDIPGLHFEACYYQGIEYCIANQLARFDAGVQGEHKLNRGFEPVISYGNYLLADSPFKQAILDVIRRENVHYQTLLASNTLDSAYRKDD